MGSPSTTTSYTKLTPHALGYMALLAVQFGMQPNLTRRFTPPQICRSTVIMSQEALKFLLAFGMLAASGQRSKAMDGWNASTWISVAGVPAALYSVQNMSALLAYQHLDALTFNVLNQTKTLSAALCCYLVMGRRQSGMQVVALFLLLLSAMVIEKIVTLDMLLLWRDTIIPDEEVDDASSPSKMDKHHFTHGVAPVLFASFLSGLAGALCQKNLQSAPGCSNRNSYLYSMELCAASTLILALSLVVSPDGTRIQQKGFWDEWTLATWIPIFTNAVGGILVGLVTKHAGSVRKGFALIFGILLSGLLQEASGGGGGVSSHQVVGGLLAALSLWLHATHPYISNPSAKAAAAVPSSSSSSTKNNGKQTTQTARRTTKSRKED